VLQSCKIVGEQMGMSLLGLVWLFALAIGAPALLGLWSVRLFYGRLEKDAEIATPAGIAIGISIVTAASALAALEPAVAKEIGDWVRLSGLFAGAMFLVGIILGWAECRKRTR
jgi:hypothetical protein